MHCRTFFSPLASLRAIVETQQDSSLGDLLISVGLFCYGEIGSGSPPPPVVFFFPKKYHKINLQEFYITVYKRSSIRTLTFLYILILPSSLNMITRDMLCALHIGSDSKQCKKLFICIVA